MRLQDAVKHTAARFGVEVRRAGAGGSDPLQAQRDLLGATSVSWIIDGGANTGRTARQFLDAFPNATVVGFEPGAEAYETLAAAFAGERRLVCHHAALADVAGERPFHVHAAGETNSLFPAAPQTDAYFDPGLTVEIGVSPVTATTVDDACRLHGIERLDILKLDVQGAELLALRGAGSMLAQRRIRLVYLEVLFAPLYEGQANYWDVAALLDGFGYRCYGLYDLRRGRRGSLVQADAIYLEPDLAAGLPAHW